MQRCTIGVSVLIPCQQPESLGKPLAGSHRASGQASDLGPRLLHGAFCQHHLVGRGAGLEAVQGRLALRVVHAGKNLGPAVPDHACQLPGVPTPSSCPSGPPGTRTIHLSSMVIDL